MRIETFEVGSLTAHVVRLRQVVRFDPDSREEFRIRSVRVPFWSFPRGKGFVVLFVVVVRAEDVVAAAGLPGYLAMPRERYNGDTVDLKQVLAIQRLVDFVNAGGASRFLA